MTLLQGALFAGLLAAGSVLVALVHKLGESDSDGGHLIGRGGRRIE